MTGERSSVLDLVRPPDLRFPEVPCPLAPLPGRVALVMAEGEMAGGIALPASGRCRPDVAQVLATGVPWLAVGDVVLVRPYVGAWLDSGLRLVGVQEWADDAIPARYVEGEIQPLQGWVLMRRDVHPWTNLPRKEGTILAAGDQSPAQPGWGALYPVGKEAESFGPLTLGLWGDSQLALVHDPVVWEKTL